ncbi:hypothetical protein ACFVT6_12870 [Streptomyces sp. NPDC058049]|uniref:hypothetical protein n=1 Tax=Streptomyces sp. NPDC058049 TaxID=3346314 RepID=UPI0036E4362F
MDNQKLRITLTLSPHSGDQVPDELIRVAAADLKSDIRRLAADHPGLTVDAAEDPDKRQRAAGAIVIEVLPSIISGLSAVVAAFVARPHQPSVTVKVNVETADGQAVCQGAADQILETIATTHHGPRTPAEAEAQPPSNTNEL